MTIDFTLTPELEELRLRIRDFVEQEVKPVEAELKDPDRIEDRKDYIEKLIAMRAKAQEAGIWLPHMPKEWGGMGLGHVELAMVQAEAAKSYYGPWVFNCQAPDEGNMHTLLNWGTDEQKERY
ncbi:MAG: acyl-CoA dehydrogenase family protein, partial [Acidimicrobiales bacterium]|nr:acyl-CoA dehydrogenase family protein [Acidimicrobiales bacterium]